MSISTYIAENNLPCTYWFDAGVDGSTSLIGNSTLTARDEEYPPTITPQEGISLPTYRHILDSSTVASAPYANFTLVYGTGTEGDISTVDSLNIRFASPSLSISNTLYRSSILARSKVLTDIPPEMQVPDMFACTVDAVNHQYTTYTITDRLLTTVVYSVCPQFLSAFLKTHDVLGPIYNLQNIIFFEPSLPERRIEDIFHILITKYNDELTEPPPPSGWDNLTETDWDNMTTASWDAIA